MFEFINFLFKKDTYPIGLNAFREKNSEPKPLTNNLNHWTITNKSIDNWQIAGKSFIEGTLSAASQNPIIYGWEIRQND